MNDRKNGGVELDEVMREIRKGTLAVRREQKAKREGRKTSREGL